MTLTKKSEHKHLRIQGTSYAWKSHKMAQKIHENNSSQEKEIDTTMNASIQPKVMFSTKLWRKSSLKPYSYIYEVSPGWENDQATPRT
jgi:hypothetical protein